MHDAAQAVLSEILSDGVAVPFSTVVRRLRQRGIPVTEAVLERRLRAPGSGVRLLDPWRGPQAALVAFLSPESEAGGAGLWVVPCDEPGHPRGEPAVGFHDLSRALRCLGRGLDQRSTRDVTRWIALVQEARQLGGWAA
jgi:hypothetical protein